MTHSIDNLKFIVKKTKQKQNTGTYFIHLKKLSNIGNLQTRENKFFLFFYPSFNIFFIFIEKTIHNTLSVASLEIW